VRFRKYELGKFLSRLLDEIRIQLVALRRAYREFDPQVTAGFYQATHDVVAIADPGKTQTF
jgi:hypothetical protein